MQRLQKKCFVGSLAFHGILVVVLAVGTAMGPQTFKSQEKFIPIDVLDLDVVMTDGESKQGGGGGGGNPALGPQVVTPPPPQPPETKPPVEELAPPPAVVEPPKPPPMETVVVTPPQDTRKALVPPDTQKKKAEKSEPKKEAKSEPKKEAKTEPKKEATKAETKKVAVNLGLVDRSKMDSKAKQKAAADAERAQKAADAKAIRDHRIRQEQIAQAIDGTIGGLQNGLSKGGARIDVSSLGAGTGKGWGAGSGPTLVNYAQWVMAVYERNWLGTDNIPSTDKTVLVEVVIARSGAVTASRITRKSGNTLLDSTVQATLSRVRSVNHAFPESATEASRTFIIEFNLASKRSAG